jgi:hypothetical protein
MHLCFAFVFSASSMICATSKDGFLLAEDHPSLTAVLTQLTDESAKNNKKDGTKWVKQHMALAEKRTLIVLRTFSGLFLRVAHISIRLLFHSLSKMFGSLINPRRYPVAC